MITIVTHQGKRVEIVLERELCSPVDMGERVRAFCHIHGSDHQRSLSIAKATGWGHCYNAACEATVLVAEWNRPVATRLLHQYYRGLTSAALPSYRQPVDEQRSHRPSFFQPLLFSPPRAIPQWQHDERDVLSRLDAPMGRSLASSLRARQYLRERGIPLGVALAAGVGYIPPAWLQEPRLRRQHGLLQRWADRIVFPLYSPTGRGYIGRTLWQWQPGMKETTHKALLEHASGPKRWIKTNPAGWFGPNEEQAAETIILVEGAFDRLTLLAAGLPSSAVVALVGTALPLDWLPARVKTVVLALDADEGGQEASSRLGEQLLHLGIHVQYCPPVQDTWGKDWNERWQHLGLYSVSPLFDILSSTHVYQLDQLA